MKINEYQELTRTTAVYPRTSLSGLSYLSLGLCSEAGEVAGKVKKFIRGDKNDDFGTDIKSELGDCFWYLSELCNHLGFSIEDVMIYNISKLKKRQGEGSLKGDGDER